MKEYVMHLMYVLAVKWCYTDWPPCALFVWRHATSIGSTKRAFTSAAGKAKRSASLFFWGR